ncbi:TetR/AcrR family transcriptional regulator [Streptomyces albicerus]|uniref:TetR/AcrR family transcriptional regulator n=1 Tax=Streptomyces albicerus TaxID=2569859 RepID=UPI00124B8BA7|nr:TetR/AcrR family transcriptional regulator [Streptomyces albicerus]
MTDSTATRRAGKRERLVAGAGELLHHVGAARMTLADVAKAADVPLGNVYYYFKTKDDLVQAVIDAHAEAIRAMLATFDLLPTPEERLRAFARTLADTGELAARHGCPHGSLCSELGKRDDGLDRSAATLMTLYVDWSQEQFRLMGKEDARDLAITLVSIFQGASLLTNALRDPDVMRTQADRLERWITSVS